MTQNLIINGVDHSAFNLEWAKRGGVLICADPESTKKLFKFVRNIDLEKIEVTVLGWLDGCPVTNFWESKTIFRMATPKEAGIEYIKRPVSDEELAELRKDRERLDAIEDMVRNSRTGVTFKHENYSEDGYVVERGFNITRYHFRSELEKTLREAIDNSMKEVQP